MMKNLVYILAFMLILFWAVVYFVFGYSGGTHTLLVIACFAIIVRVIQGAEPNNNEV